VNAQGSRKSDRNVILNTGLTRRASLVVHKRHDHRLAAWLLTEGAVRALAANRARLSRTQGRRAKVRKKPRSDRPAG
jgi:hypothetical protein